MRSNSIIKKIYIQTTTAKKLRNNIIQNFSYTKFSKSNNNKKLSLSFRIYPIEKIKEETCYCLDFFRDMIPLQNTI